VVVKIFIIEFLVCTEHVILIFVSYTVIVILCCLDLEKSFTEIRQVPTANRKLPYFCSNIGFRHVPHVQTD